MMNKFNNLILTLDAGGTNLVFSAVEEGTILKETVHLPTASQSLEEFLKKVSLGFSNLQSQINRKATAISFCFPGPADYESGIIGDLENLPFFSGGIPLARRLENKFHIPVFINNDGDLFALGEALEGLLPEINSLSHRKYHNLLGVTLGTGFGGGIINNGKLYRGDNSAGGEINRMSSFLNKNESVEETLSIRGIRYLFAQQTGMNFDETPEPYEIFQIGMAKKSGNQQAAVEAWKIFGWVLGDALANAISLTDSCVVIGGGLSGAHPLFLQYAVDQMNGTFQKKDKTQMPRMEIKAYNWENSDDRKAFLRDESILVKVPFSEEKQRFYPVKKIAVGINRLGTSKAVAQGAYAFAFNHLNK